MYEEDILTLREILKASKNLCVFTGAGISVPSGIQFPLRRRAL